MARIDTGKKEIALVALVTVLALLLRFFRLGHQSLWIDEILTLGASDPPPSGIPFAVKLLWDVHGPLYTLVVHVWRSVSETDAWLRVPGAVAGVASVPLLYAWLKREVGQEAALTGALFMALSPFNIYYSQEVRFYSLLTMMTVVSLIAYRLFIDRPSARNATLLGIALGLACLSHLMALFICAGIAVHIAVTRRACGPHLRWGILAAAIALVIVSPWIYRQLFFLRLIQETEPSARAVVYRMEEGRFPPLLSYPYAVYAFATGFSFGPDLRELRASLSTGALIRRYAFELGVATVVFGAALIGGIARLRRQRRLALFISIPAATILLVTLAAVLKIKVFNARYLTPAFPVFIAMLACGAVRRRAHTAVMTAAVCLLMIVSAANYHFSPRYARDDFKGAIRVIASGEREGDVVFAPGMEPIVRWYYRGNRPVEPLYAPHLDRERIEKRLASIVDGRRRMWYLRCRPWDTDADGHIESFLAANLRVVDSWHLPGVTLYLFEIPGAGG